MIYVSGNGGIQISDGWSNRRDEFSTTKYSKALDIVM